MKRKWAMQRCNPSEIVSVTKKERGVNPFFYIYKMEKDALLKKGVRNVIIGLVIVMVIGNIPGIGPFLGVIGAIMVIIGFVQVLRTLF
jgi:hypothetical protein